MNGEGDGICSTASLIGFEPRRPASPDPYAVGNLRR
jgi:hypothetical protein